MNIALKITADRQKVKSNSTLQKRFDALWKKLQRKKRQNNKFKADIDALTSIYRDELLPAEVGMVDYLYPLVERLIDFSQRKSLSNRHRDGLDHWILETISVISQFDSIKARTLSDRYFQAMEEMFGAPPEHDELEKPSIEQMFADMQNTNSGKDHPPEEEQLDMFGGWDELENAEMDADAMSDDEPQLQLEPEEAKLLPFNGDKLMRTLFRRAANKLHPDKESNLDRKAEKQHLMTKLLEARKNEDVMTMLILYVEHIEGGNLALAEQEMKNICDLLEENASRLDNEQEKYLSDNPQYQIVYDTLYAPTKVGQRKKLTTSLARVTQINIETSKTTKALRNLAVLRSTLNHREEMIWSKLWDIDQEWF